MVEKTFQFIPDCCAEISCVRSSIRLSMKDPWLLRTRSFEKRHVAAPISENLLLDAHPPIIIRTHLLTLRQ
jgi:hypothetical protein